MIKFSHKKISIIICLAFVLCAGLLIFSLNLKPTTAEAKSFTGNIDTDGKIDLRIDGNVNINFNESSMTYYNTSLFPSLDVEFNVGEDFMNKFNQGYTYFEREEYLENPLYPGLGLDLEFYIRNTYTIAIGLTTAEVTLNDLSEDKLLSTLTTTKNLHLSDSASSSEGMLITYQHCRDFNDLGGQKKYLQATDPYTTLSSPTVKLKFNAEAVYSAYKAFYQTNAKTINLTKQLKIFICLVEETEETMQPIEGYARPDTIDLVSYKIKSLGSFITSINIRTMLAQQASTFLPSKEYATSLYKYLGWDPSGESTFTLKYRTMKSVSSYDEKSETFKVDWFSAHSQKGVIEQMQKRLGVTSYTDFNACWRDEEILENGIVNLNSERVIFQALGYNYSYNPQTKIGEIAVEYTDFFAKDFAIELRSNDPLDNAAIYIYSTNIVSDEYNTTLQFDYATIEEQLYNQKGWIVSIKEGDVISTVNLNITVYRNDDMLKMIVPNDNQDLLTNATILITANIIEDIDIVLSYEYISLSYDSAYNVVKTTLTTQPTTIKYSEFIQLNSNNFYVHYGNVIDSALELEGLEDCNYMTYSSVTRLTVEQGVSYKFVVNYDYKMLIKVIHPDGTVSYEEGSFLNGGSYTLDTLGVVIPNGERVSEIIIHTPESLGLEINEENLANSNIFIKCNTYEDIIGEIEVITTDVFFVTVNYLKQYDKTPFAYATTKSGTAKVSDIPTQDANYSEFLMRFINSNSLKCLRSNVESIEVSFNGVDTYNFKLNYTYCSLRKIDYNGNVAGEVKVPLTKYKDWALSMNQDWSILFLNMPGTTYFEYSSIELDDGTIINEDNLYGYFACAVFEEKTIDLNYYFKGYSGDGVVSMFESTKATGGNLYRRVAGIMNNSENFFVDLACYPMLAFCELVNSDNVMYHSYFFYLDCKVDPNKTYISNGRADGADDNDGAFDNVIQNGQDKVESVFTDLFINEENGKLSVFAWIAIGIIGIITLAIVIRILKK